MGAKLDAYKRAAEERAASDDSEIKWLKLSLAVAKRDLAYAQGQLAAADLRNMRASWRVVGPTEEEIDAHYRRGGAWLVRGYCAAKYSVWVEAHRTPAAVRQACSMPHMTGVIPVDDLWNICQWPEAGGTAARSPDVEVSTAAELDLVAPAPAGAAVASSRAVPVWAMSVEQWNETYPAGTLVRYWSGMPRSSTPLGYGRTESAAHNHPEHHAPQVRISGRAEPVLLRDVEVMS